MATHEETPLLTKFERTDVVRHRVRRGAAILGVCATLSVAAFASRGFGASASAGPMKLGDALDDALAELRDLDGSMDDGATVSVAATTSALEPLVLDPPIEGTEAPDGTQDQEQMEDATQFRWTGTEDAPVPEKGDDPVLDKYGQPLAADDVDTGVPNTEESVGDGDALGPDSEDAVSEDFKWSGSTRTTDPTTATDQTTTSPMTDASAPAASSIGPGGDETEPDSLQEAPGPFSGAFADVAADGPSSGGNFEDDAADAPDAAAADADDDAADDAVADDDDDADAEDGADGDLTSLEETSAPHTQSTKSVIEDNSSEVQGQVEDNSSEVQEKGDTEISSNAAKVDDVPPAGPTSGGAFEDASDAVLDDGWGDDWSDLSTDLDRIKKLAKNLGPSMAPTLVANYPPAPPRPDLEKRIPKENIITRIDQSQLSFKFSPKFPGKLPKPSVAGNEVAAVAVANVPGFGFSDAQIELVREHKERNAGLPAGSLTVKGFYYAIVDSFNLTNCACGGDSLNDFLVAPAMRESFSLAQASLSVPIVGVAPEHCKHTNVPKGTYANFNSRATIIYTVAANRTDLPSFESIALFVKEASAVVHTSDFYTLLQAGILESSASKKHAGSEIIATQREPTFTAFIVLEGPKGSALAVAKTNGPIMAA